MLEEIMISIKSVMEKELALHLSNKDRDELHNMIGNYLSLYMNDFLLFMKKPNFHEELAESILEEFKNLLENIYDEEIEEELRIAIQKSTSIFFSTVMPRRSYKTTFDKPRVNKNKISTVIEYLRKVPQNEQRTREWYEDRWNMISASSALKALSSDSA